MTTSNIQLISRERVRAAHIQLYRETPHDKPWRRALDKGYNNLHYLPWSFDGEIMKVMSSKRNGTWYTVTVDSCTCAAGQEEKSCWHAAGWALLKRASMTWLFAHG